METFFPSPAGFLDVVGLSSGSVRSEALECEDEGGSAVLAESPVGRLMVSVSSSWAAACCVAPPTTFLLLVAIVSKVSVSWKSKKKKKKKKKKKN